MAGEMSWEKRFEILSQINRASHFEWRRAALKACPGLDPMKLVLAYWEEVGHDTAKAYIKHFRKRLEQDPDASLAEMVADSFVFSSVSMGEDAKRVSEKESPGHAYMRHDACPWKDWHERFDLIEEDRPGCDMWLKTLIDDINQEFGSKITFKTIEALPEGGSCCLRHVWED